MKKALLPSLAAVAFAMNAIAAPADNVPTLDVGPLCRAEAQSAPGYTKNCLMDQKRAQEELSRQWGQFPAADRTSCTQMAISIAGVQSYVELLTCLQMKQDVRNLPKQ